MRYPHPYKNSHSGFPVHGSNGTFLGVILRSDLLHILRTAKALQLSDSFDADALRRAYEFDVPDFSIAARERLSLSSVRLTAEELDMFLDLGPYLNPAPYIVQADTSLSKVYNMFYQLNLRHLCVVPHVNDVIGIITRKDLHPEIVERRLPGGMAPSSAGPGDDGIRSRLGGVFGGDSVRRKLTLTSLLERGEGATEIEMVGGAGPGPGSAQKKQPPGRVAFRETEAQVPQGGSLGAGGAGPSNNGHVAAFRSPAAAKALEGQLLQDTTGAAAPPVRGGAQVAARRGGPAIQGSKLKD